MTNTNCTLASTSVSGFLDLPRQVIKSLIYLIELPRPNPRSDNLCDSISKSNGRFILEKANLFVVCRATYYQKNKNDLI